MSRVVAVISGSRRLYSQVHRAAIREYLTELTKHRHTHVVVIHGAQRGADSIADEEARRLNLEPWGIPYFDELDDPKRRYYPGGPKRNECVVNVGCVLRDTKLYSAVMGAFPDDESTGTWRAVEYAARRGIVADIKKQKM